MRGCAAVRYRLSQAAFAARVSGKVKSARREAPGAMEEREAPQPARRGAYALAQRVPAGCSEGEVLAGVAGLAACVLLCEPLSVEMSPHSSPPSSITSLP